LLNTGAGCGIRMLPETNFQGLTEHGRRFKNIEVPSSSR
jgi:hypothetical protein